MCSREVFVATSAADSSILVVDPRSEVQLAAYKNNVSGPGGIALIQSRNSHGAPANGFLAASQKGKQAIHFWPFPFGRDALHLKCHTPEGIGPLCCTRDGVFCIGAGVSSGRIYIWCCGTGELVRAWDAHYKAVSALSLTDDDSHLISGGKDSIINVWSLADIVDTSSGSDSNVEPLFAWAEHALPITALHCSVGGVSGRIFSTSLDQTCKFWEIGCSNGLYSVVLPAAATAVTTDLADTRLYIGTDQGNICPVDLNSAAAAASAAVLNFEQQEVEGQSSLVAAGEELFVGHTRYITGLQTSHDSLILVSASHDGDVRVWDCNSGQCLRSIHCHKGGVSTLLLLPYPREDTRLKSYTDRGKGLHTCTPLAPFKKYSAVASGESARARALSTVPVLLPRSQQSMAAGTGAVDTIVSDGLRGSCGNREASCIALHEHLASKCTDLSRAEQGLFLLHAGAKGNGTANGKFAAAQSQQLHELAEETSLLQAENLRWKRVNNQLYQMLVQDVLSKKQKTAQ